jgi:hypothetical protein
VATPGLRVWAEAATASANIVPHMTAEYMFLIIAFQELLLI